MRKIVICLMLVAMGISAARAATRLNPVQPTRYGADERIDVERVADELQKIHQRTLAFCFARGFGELRTDVFGTAAGRIYGGLEVVPDAIVEVDGLTFYTKYAILVGTSLGYPNHRTTFLMMDNECSTIIAIRMSRSQSSEDDWRITGMEKTN